MKNEFSRRNFLRLSGAVLATAALTGTLTGCGGEKPAAVVEPFGKEMTAGKCKVTFLTVGGSGSSVTKAPIWVQAVTLRVENLGSEEVALTKENFTVVMNDSQKLEIDSCYEFINDAATGVRDTVPVAAGKTTEINLWLAKDSQPETDKVTTITATATIQGVTVSAVETKENFRYWFG